MKPKLHKSLAKNLHLIRIFIMVFSVVMIFCRETPLQAAGQTADQTKKQTEDQTGTTSQLYALSAVLMDADNGRVLLEKNGGQVMPMASTTKIMTCILTMEAGNTEEIAGVSSYAAGQPKVHMGVRKGEYYRINDLLYSLMLESHNDAAVIIAEHFGSKWAGLSADCCAHSEEESKKAVLAFTARMNALAEKIGCTDTFFVTPNGLDGTLTAVIDGQTVTKEHATTAIDLARILSYCIKKSPARESFLKVTGTESYSYADYEEGDGGNFNAGRRSISCQNHNAFLRMMDGALSGKTGFTGKAGYCYAGALTREGKTFSVALLACGWPNHKTWKWHDTKILMDYGLANYTKQDIYRETKLMPIPVADGQKESVCLFMPERKLELLLSPQDVVTVELKLPESIFAPVIKGEIVGEQVYYVNKMQYAAIPVSTFENVPKIDYVYCVRKIIAYFAL